MKIFQYNEYQHSPQYQYCFRLVVEDDYYLNDNMIGTFRHVNKFIILNTMEIE